MITSITHESSHLFQTRNTEFSTLNSEEFRTLSASGILIPKSHPTTKTISAKESIRKKLTARITPMTRNGGNDLGKKLNNDGKSLQKQTTEKPSVCRPPATIATTTSTVCPSSGQHKPTSVIVKREREDDSACGVSMVQSSYGTKHKNTERSQDVEPQSKFPKLDLPSASPFTPTTGTHPAIFQPFSSQFENMPMMSLLTASQGHLATLQDDDGDTPLHIAIAQSQVHLVQRLIQMTLTSEISLDIYNKLKQTPLHLAVITNQPEVVRMLIRAGADGNIPDRNGQTAVHLACQRSSIECLMELVNSRFPVNFETKNYDGLTPLHEAVKSNSPDIIRFLVACGANVDTKDGKSGRTPLHYAVELELLPIIQILINSGANVSAASYSGSTPIQTASGHNMHQVLRILLGSLQEASAKNSASKSTSGKIKGAPKK